MNRRKKLKHLNVKYKKRNLKINWKFVIISLIILFFLINYILSGSLLHPNVRKFIITFGGPTVDIEWRDWDGTRCWDFDKRSNLMALDVLGDCNEECNEKYHLIARDYICDPQTGKVTCICKQPS